MTAQISETIFYDGHELSMCSNPLGDYFVFAGIDPGFECDCTALWRGYMGTWEIREHRLYLIGLKGTLKGGASTSLEAFLPGVLSLEAFFPGFPDRVFAHWYSGNLRIPQGEMLKYVHMGYGSAYESDLIISIEKGVVKETHVRHNEIPSTPDTPKWYEIAKRIRLYAQSKALALKYSIGEIAFFMSSNKDGRNQA